MRSSSVCGVEAGSVFERREARENARSKLVREEGVAVGKSVVERSVFRLDLPFDFEDLFDWRERLD